MRLIAAAIATVAIALMGPVAVAQDAARDRDRWLALAKSRFAVPDGVKPIDLLVEMSPLLASPDPVLRDDGTLDSRRAPVAGRASSCRSALDRQPAGRSRYPG